MTIKLNISDIQVRPEFMIREIVDPELVAQYQENLSEIITISPITVYETPEGYILSDGYHRLAAAKNLGWVEISSQIIKGSVEDAHAAACLANLQHGKPLTRAERERAVKQYIILKPELSNYAISEKTGLSEATIRRYRTILEVEGNVTKPELRFGLDGKRRQLPTASNNAVEALSPEAQKIIEQMKNGFKKCKTALDIEEYRLIWMLCTERRTGQLLNESDEENLQNNIDKLNDLGFSLEDINKCRILANLSEDSFTEYLMDKIARLKEEYLRREKIWEGVSSLMSQLRDSYLPLVNREGALEGVGVEEANPVKSNLTGKIQKTNKILAEIGKEAEKAPVAEAIRQEIASSIETTQKTPKSMGDVGVEEAS